MFASPSLARRVGAAQAAHGGASASAGEGACAGNVSHLGTPVRKTRRKVRSSSRRMEDELDLIVSSPTEEAAPGGLGGSNNNNNDHHRHMVTPTSNGVLDKNIKNFCCFGIDSSFLTILFNLQLHF